MVPFVSSSNHQPWRTHDGLPDRGLIGSPSGPYACCCGHLAALGLGGFVVCSPGCSRTPGGDLLHQAINRYTVVPGPQYGVSSLALGHRLINTLCHFSFNGLMLVRARPHYKIFAANTSIPFPHRTENNTEMTETYVKVKYMFNVQNYNEVDKHVWFVIFCWC